MTRFAVNREPAVPHLQKRVSQIGAARVAYYDQGIGPAVLLLHGCPFASFVWRRLIPLLAPTHRCLAPDLLGLGDTETPLDADWSLRAQAATMIGLLDALGIARAHVVGHDHGVRWRRFSPSIRRGSTGSCLRMPRRTTIGPRRRSGHSYA